MHAYSDASLQHMGIDISKKSKQKSDRAIFYCLRDKIGCRFRIVAQRTSRSEWTVLPDESTFSHTHGPDPRFLQNPEWRPEYYWARQADSATTSSASDSDSAHSSDMDTEESESESQAAPADEMEECSESFAEDELGDDSSATGSPAKAAFVSSTSTNNSYTTSELHTISAQEAPARLDNDAPEDVDGEALDLPEPDPDLDGEPMLLDEFELSKEDPSPAEDELAPTQEAAAWSVETLSRHLSQSGLAHLASTLHDAGAFDHPRGLTYSTKNHLEEVVDWIQTSGGVPFGHLSVLRLRKALIALDDSPSPSLADLAIHAEGPIWPLKQLGAALDEKYGLSYLAEALRDVGVLDDASALYYATTEYLEDTVKMVQDLRKNAEPPLRGITIGHLRQALQALGKKLAV
ncbi:hypothetical protein RQP46_005044 [Phenoliferia psychrophenolica]